MPIATATAPVLTPAQVLGVLTKGWDQSEGAIIAAVSSWSINELIKLGLEEVTNCWRALKHFINNIRNGMSWGEAMANMLTEVWNDAKHELANLATDFVEAVGKVFENVGLIPAQTQV